MSRATRTSSGTCAVTVFTDQGEPSPKLAPDNNPVSAAMLYLFRSDVFITVAARHHVGRLRRSALATRLEKSSDFPR